ncbi:MAG TPA: hypothetical protein VLE53_02120 [Gemmatimonadaceae bacterium]|nr:hypothetical protein [Gemmatimonadaceae bacterium]
MSVAPRVRQIAKPRRASAMTVGVWAFVVIEALGIGYVLWTY